MNIQLPANINHEIEVPHVTQLTPHDRTIIYSASSHNELLIKL